TCKVDAAYLGALARANLHASPDFFKQLSLEFQQLKLTVQILETFIFRASVRGYELGDKRLLLILDQLEIFASKAKYLLERLEKLLCGSCMD
ncbi:MAG: hypothetical protein K2X02_09245, partial [Alphaproteobacteria bacterium]|nr:hypothetical protein [Alphaproteobacteria bacterium]